ncbi:hypothetical protein, partial [Polaribacter reichenbachii]
MEYIKTKNVFIKSLFNLLLSSLFLLACNSKKKENIKPIESNSAIIIINNPLEKKLELEYTNSKGSSYNISKVKNDTFEIKLNKRTYLSIRTKRNLTSIRRRSSPYLAYNLNIFSNDTLKINTTIKKDSVFFTNSSRTEYSNTLKEISLVKENRELDSIKKSLYKYRNNPQLFNKTYTDILQKKY